MTIVSAGLAEFLEDFLGEGGLAGDVIFDFLDEGVLGEGAAADGSEVLVAAGLVTVGAETGHAAEAEFFASVFVDHFVEHKDRALPLLDDVSGLLTGDSVEVNLEEFFDMLSGPGPFVFVILGMDRGEDSGKLSDVGYCVGAGGGGDAIAENIDDGRRSDEAGKVNPITGALAPCLPEGFSKSFVSGDRFVLNSGDQRVAEELGEGGLIIAYALKKGGVANDGFAVVIVVGPTAGGVHEPMKDIETVQHLLHGVRAQ